MSRLVLQLSRIILVTLTAALCSGQVPSSWRTFDGTHYAFKYPPDWQLDRVSEREVWFGPAGRPPSFRLLVTNSFGGDIEGFIASEKTAHEEIAARERWTVHAHTEPGLRGGLQLVVDFGTNNGPLALTALALGVGRGPLFYLTMASTPDRNFSDYEQFWRPVVNSLVLKLPASAIEGNWRRSQANYVAALNFRPDGSYAYSVRQTNPPAWELEVDGRYTLRQPDPNSFSDRLAVLDLAPSQYRFSSGLPASSQPGELVRLMAEGFPATTPEPFEVLCVQRLNLVLKARQPGLGNWQPIQTPSATPIRVVDAASYREGAVAPGSLISLFGTFGAREAAATSLPLPSSLSGVSVTIAGRVAPIHYVGPNQLNVQVPFDAPVGAASLLVNSNGNTTSGSMLIARTAPGIFKSSGDRAVAANQNYTFNTPANPAPPGSYLTVYITGHGAFRTPVASGAGNPSNPPAYTLADTAASIGGRAAEVSFSGGAPGLAGVGQVNVRVPTGLNPGDQPLVITIGGESSNVTIVSVGP